VPIGQAFLRGICLGIALALPPHVLGTLATNLPVRLGRSFRLSRMVPDADGWCTRRLAVVGADDEDRSIHFGTLSAVSGGFLSSSTLSPIWKTYNG
jgi:hypothetical protein